LACVVGARTDDPANRAEGGRSATVSTEDVVSLGKRRAPLVGMASTRTQMVGDEIAVRAGGGRVWRLVANSIGDGGV